MEPRLRELIDRLVAVGPGGVVGSASEGRELHDLVEELQKQADASAAKLARARYLALKFQLAEPEHCWSDDEIEMLVDVCEALDG